MLVNHRKFLISFERGDPTWDLLGLPNAAELPAVAGGAISTAYRDRTEFSSPGGLVAEAMR